MPLVAGTRIGPYEILAPLGAGGMGEVYRARDTRLRRDAALKCMPLTISRSPLAIERFRREAQLLAGLNHPHIAAVYGLENGVDGGTVLAMELVPGETLAERLRRGPVPLEEALALARQMAEALEYAHERGIVHRDLKPANIQITPEEQVKVLDFGLAKALAPELSEAGIFDAPTVTSPATHAGAVLGTAAYMSPEQARGKAVDRRADIWAFGAVLYEMLSGQQTFPGDSTSDTMAAVLRAEPDWKQLPAATPFALRSLIERTLRKEVRQRLQSMGDARIALEEIGRGDPGPAAMPSARHPHWLRRTGLAIAAGAAIAATAFSLILRAPKPVPMHFRALTAMAGVQRDPALSPDGRSVAFASDRDGSYNIYVGVIGGSSLVQVTHGSAIKASPAWARDGASLAYAQFNDSGLWDIWQVPALGGTPRLLVRNAKSPAWSPTGLELAYVQASDGTLWITVPGQTPQRLAPQLAGIRDPRFSPSGRQIAFTQGAFGGGPYTSLEVLNLASGALRHLTSELAGMARSPVWTPDGRSIYFASSQGGTFNIWKIAATGGTPQQITTGQGDDAELDLSSDGKRLAFATFRTDSHIAEVPLGASPGAFAPRVLTTDPARNQSAPVFSPDGKRLAYFSFLKGVEPEQIWAANADGSDAAPLVVNRNHNIFPSWSQDGSRILFGSWAPESHGTLTLVEVPSSGGDLHVLLGPMHTLSACPGPQGSVIFAEAHALASLSPISGKTRTLGPLPHPPLSEDLLCAPDGSAIAYVARARYDDDPQRGLWVYDFRNPPRQIFRGWVGSLNVSVGPHGQIYFLAGRPDLKYALWAVNWDGTGLKDMRTTVPLLYDYFWDAFNLISAAPNGAVVAFDYDDALQANLGLITFGK